MCQQFPSWLNISKVESGRKYFKEENYMEKVILGGNYAQFGSYGKQSGDNDASISAENQWNETKIIKIRYQDTK